MEDIHLLIQHVMQGSTFNLVGVLGTLVEIYTVHCYPKEEKIVIKH